MALENRELSGAFDADGVIGDLIDELERAAREITPAFILAMPRAYFDDTTQEMRLAHLKAILAAEASGMTQTVTVRDAEDRHFTFIGNGSHPGQLSEFVRRLPRTLPLTSAQVYTSESGEWVLDIFHFGEHGAYDPGDVKLRAKADEVCGLVDERSDDSASDRIRDHLLSCDASYLRTTPAHQIYRHWLMAEEIRESGNVLVQLEPYHDTGLDRLTVGFADYDSRLMFERISLYVGRQLVDIQHAYLDSFERAGHGIALLTFVIDRKGTQAGDESRWRRIEIDLRRLVHLDPIVFELADEMAACDLEAAEILAALSRLAHQKLVKSDALRFSHERIVATLVRYPALALGIADAFRERFALPPAADAAARSDDRIAGETDTQDAASILAALSDAVRATLRTNLRLPNRRALALRIDPAYLQTGSRDEMPYGVFFVSGYRFDGFHVRFRDIARGGVRIVRPAGAEQYTLEAERHYDEAYGLADAQQHKNKDIPEGGSKGVILASPDADPDQAGRAFADALLDLIIPDPELHAMHADYYRRDELLYLGPDENVSNSLITWIVERARRRGHPMPDAFMSSKPGAGINHKEYGVTSEGLAVFLEHALRSVGIDPCDRSFTVKMTGGPDGDVAGNAILILGRDYPDTARIVAIADGSGCAEDPAGLEMAELSRLVDEALPIAAFDPSRLGAGGRLVRIDDPDGIKLRNSVHNRVAADAFIPAGGRPNTINEMNWEAFLDAGGGPSSRVIVEGANLFISPEARCRLADKGAIIIKDSSANKAGVICSSYEIVASMLLDEQAFLELKPRYVGEVLAKLRALARLEAQILFREHRHKPAVHLPVLSERLSRAINSATDAIDETIHTLTAAHPDLVRKLVLDHLPASLSERCGAGVFDRIPAAYLNRIVASSLASRIVYREGLDWFESMPAAAIAELAERYLVAEAAIAALAREVRGSTLENRDRIAKLLESGGVAAAIDANDD